MRRELPPLDISQRPELLQLAEEVQQAQMPRVLRRGTEDLAIVMPAARPPHRRRARARTGPHPRPTSIAQRTAGALRRYRRVPPPSPREEREAFEQAVAEQVAESMGE